MLRVESLGSCSIEPFNTKPRIYLIMLLFVESWKIENWLVFAEISKDHYPPTYLRVPTRRATRPYSKEQNFSFCKIDRIVGWSEYKTYIGARLLYFFAPQPNVRVYIGITIYGSNRTNLVLIYKFTSVRCLLLMGPKNNLRQSTDPLF